MTNYYSNDQVLNVPGYEIHFTRFSDSIIKGSHFAIAEGELSEVLNNFYIKEENIIKGGGGLSLIVQNLADLLKKRNWLKATIESNHHIGDRVLTSETHEIDHYKSSEHGNIGLEIEWNNKDPFFDRDLENFRKLHHIGELSMGIIITRGESLQKELYNVIRNFLEEMHPFSADQLGDILKSSTTAKAVFAKLITLSKEESLNKIARAIFASKYGESTTHMKKLLLRLDRGVGNPCPFILIGIGKERLMKQ